MAWKKHTRLMTDEQFSDGTTIDGNRVDKAMEDTVERFNNLELRDMANRFFPCHYVSGFTPQSPINTATFVAVITTPGTGYSAGVTGVATTGGGGTGITVDIVSVSGGGITGIQIASQGTGAYAVGDVLVVTGGGGDARITLKSSTMHHWPWLHTFNHDVASGTAAPENYLNPLRVKSTQVDAIVNKTVGSWPTGAQYAWTSEWFFGQPAILDSLQLVMALDNTGVSDAAYKPFATSTPFIWPGRYLPANKEANDDADDMQLVVQVADPFEGRQRARDAIEVAKHTFPINHNAVSHINLTAVGNDMTPAYPTNNFMAGAAVQLKDLNIPIHLNAIVRVSIVIPQYNSTTAYGFWGTEPWNKMIPTLLMTTLEEIE